VKYAYKAYALGFLLAEIRMLLTLLIGLLLSWCMEHV